MKISIWDIFKYLYRRKILIVCTLVAAILLAVIYTEKTQSYEAQTIIQYADESISDNGTTPDGNEFDSYEIVAPDVITNVIKDLSLGKSVDNIRSRVTVTAIIPDSEKDKEEQFMKQGEVYTYYPNTYTVVYSGKQGESQTEVRDILDSIIQNYITAYSLNYTNQASVNDITFDKEIGSYDYIELAEVISDRIDATVTALGTYNAAAETFRSSSTGMTFGDLKNEYTHLQEYNMAKIFSNIYRGQITKDKDLLIQKYTQRRESYILDSVHDQSQADLTKDRMDNFAEANKEVPNSYNENTSSNDDGLEIIQDIFGAQRKDEETGEIVGGYDSETTYDNLITDYVDREVSANNNWIDAEHCSEVIEKFTVPLEEDVDVEALTQEVSEDLESTRLEMAEIYKLLSQTISDYNDVNAVTHISQLTGVQYYATQSVYLYVLIFGVLGLMLSSIFAIACEMAKEMKLAEAAGNKKKKKKKKKKAEEGGTETSKPEGAPDGGARAAGQTASDDFNAAAIKADSDDEEIMRLLREYKETVQ